MNRSDEIYISAVAHTNALVLRSICAVLSQEQKDVLAELLQKLSESLPEIPPPASSKETLALMPELIEGFRQTLLMEVPRD